MAASGLSERAAVIRKFLVPVRGDGKGGNVFAHAAALARRFGAHIVVIHCRPRPEDLLPYGVPVPAFLRGQIEEQAVALADAEEENLRDKFEALASELGLILTQSPSAGIPSASWVEERGRQFEVIRRHGRLADLICVAKPDRDRNLGANTLKSALFYSGRPVMMCPPAETAPANLGRHIAIAWNGSTEAARAVALTLDLVAQADIVTILNADGDEVGGAGADDLLRYLADRGIEAALERFQARRGVGGALLERSGEIGADLLVMGAYGDSHEHETVFGGNTQTVVDTASLPVVLVH